uniref:Ubiquitin-conjugating enzyme E2 n=1 Tax=Trepomonas sp. PC1 TaxID=1076344 RepID=A0A146KHF1_9EUKA|eukprot:JAP96102.1 Ubiquitin-conjugating enzyme E2 [Trepomonas sp. PC1]
MFESLKQLQKEKDHIQFFLVKTQPHVLHVSFKGPDFPGYKDGIYHMHLNLTGYPQSAPRIQMTHPNGGYSPNQNICLVGITNSSSSFSSGTTIEGLVVGIQTYMVPSNRINDGSAMIRSSQSVVEELAKQSLTYKCSVCGADHSKLFKKQEEKAQSEEKQQVEKKVVKKIKQTLDLSDD